MKRANVAVGPVAMTCAAKSAEAGGGAAVNSAHVLARRLGSVDAEKALVLLHDGACKAHDRIYPRP